MSERTPYVRHGNLKYKDDQVARWSALLDIGFTPGQVAKKLRLRCATLVSDKVSAWKMRQGKR